MRDLRLVSFVGDAKFSSEKEKVTRSGNFPNILLRLTPILLKIKKYTRKCVSCEKKRTYYTE